MASRSWIVRAGVCAALTLLLRAPSLVRPIMDIDEGSYAAIACRMLAGGLPYRDGVENKAPGIYYVYEWVFALFGRYNMAALHAAVALAALATALLCGASARELARSPSSDGGGRDDGGDAGRADWLAALGYTVYSTTYYPKMLAGNTEMFLVLPAAGALLLLVRARGRLAPLVAAGALAALALLLKQVAAFVVCVLLAGVAWQAWRTRRLGRGLLEIALIAVGFAAPLAALAWWYRRLGILDEAIFWSWTYIMKYYLPAGAQPFWMNLLEYLCPFLLLVSPLLVLATAARPLARYAVAWIWFAAGLAAALVGGRMYGHYFLMMMPGLCVLAGVGGAPLLGPAAASPWPRRFFMLATPLVGLGALLSAALYEPATESFWSRKPDYVKVTDYVQRATAPDDRIFVWGWFPPLYVQSNRCPSTRFVTVHVLAGAGQGGDGTKGHSVPRGWELLLEDLEKAPPPLILDTSTADLHFNYAAIAKYPPLARFVDAHYREEARVEGVRILRLQH